MKKNLKNLLLYFCILLGLILVFIYYNKSIKNKSIKETFVDYTTIPFVLILYNTHYFLENFIKQIKQYPNPIIILDNKSTYEPLLDYYVNLKEELGDRVDIRLLDENYGHLVYLKLKSTLPTVYILSDVDLELSPNMPNNFVEILYNITNKYKISKVALALSTEDKDEFIPEFSDLVYNHEKQHWDKKVDDSDYEMYYATVDTTFCLVNLNYPINNNGINYNADIRIAGDFTCKHLPWYNNYLKYKMPRDELTFWIKNNISSSLLQNKIVQKHLGIDNTQSDFMNWSTIW